MNALDTHTKITLAGGRGNWKKVIVRPVEIKGQQLWQMSYFDEKKDISKNYDCKTAEKKLGALLHMGYKVTKTEAVGSLGHDRVKKYILPADTRTDWLVGVGIQNQDGSIRAERRDKWEQINQFLKNLDEVWKEARLVNQRIKIVDVGCGNAYLTFAAAYYFKEVVKLPIDMVGIDINPELVTRNQDIVQELGWDELKFVQAQAEKLEINEVDIVLALHACDTATDEALAKAMQGEAKIILAAPCCQHDLQTQLGATPETEAIFRDGILKERLGDVLTDSLRAAFLRAKGYRTEVVQFIDSKHTPKNLLIRAIKSRDIDKRKYAVEYTALKKYWKVEPYIEKLISL